MNKIKVQDAIGSILCHDITRIVKDEIKDTAFRKGHIVREEDIELLLSMRKERLYVWEQKDGMVHLAELGYGGLCLNCSICNYPNCQFGKGV